MEVFVSILKKEKGIGAPPKTVLPLLPAMEEFVSVLEEENESCVLLRPKMCRPISRNRRGRGFFPTLAFILRLAVGRYPSGNVVAVYVMNCSPTGHQASSKAKSSNGTNKTQWHATDHEASDGEDTRKLLLYNLRPMLNCTRYAQKSNINHDTVNQCHAISQLVYLSAFSCVLNFLDVTRSAF